MPANQIESWQNFIAMRNMSYNCLKKINNIVVIIVNLVSYINKIMCLFRQKFVILINQWEKDILLVEKFSKNKFSV